MIEKIIVWFLGSFVGAVCALELGVHWVFGSLIGGLAGFGLMARDDIAPAFKGAWRKVYGWRAPWKRVGQFFEDWLYWSIVFHLFGCLAVVLFFSLSLTLGGDRITLWGLIFLPIFGGVAAGLVFNVLAFSLNSQEERKSFHSAVIHHLNIISFSVFAVRWFIQGVPKALSFSVSFCKKAPSFCREFAIRIHSKKAITATIFCAAGAAVGYFSGSAIIGGLSGVVVGLLEHTMVYPLLRPGNESV